MRRATVTTLFMILALVVMTIATLLLYFCRTNEATFKVNKREIAAAFVQCHDFFEENSNHLANFTATAAFTTVTAAPPTAIENSLSTFDNEIQVDTKRNMKERVAVCVTGQPRTLNLSTTDPDFPLTWGSMRNAKGTPMDGGTVAGSIQKNLFTPLEKYGFDVFMYISTPQASKHFRQDNPVRYPEPGNCIACEPLRPKNTSNHLFCTVRLELEVRVAMPETFENYYYAGEHKKQVQLLHQLQDQLKCFQQVKAVSKYNNITYSHIARLRPDTQMIEPFPSLETLDFGEPGSRKILYHSKKNCCCGNEDSFSIGTYDVMSTYLSRYNTLQGLPKEIALKDPEKQWTAENFLVRELARVDNASFVGRDEINACIVKPVSRKATGDM